ncbi:Tim44 domain-containing protein [Thiohalocapsa sp. ML1]|uniref:Tim44 domain-containing protein n=1 Tax=Thiohalocapsa sp. ML1 TaxID=1431688 RepID=UPI0007321F6E|nr:TIM44-like domain-containing protein [Thiohalocapsa sp. ML1]
MKTFLIALLTLFAVGALVLPDTADARRLGGGKSLGKQYTAPRQAQRPQAPQRDQQAAGQQRPGAAPAAGQRPRTGMGWLGPLAGLAAGGLLASMFFGDAFDGFQIMDFLLIAALIFGGFMLFKMLRRNRSAGPTPLPVGAGAAYRAHDQSGAQSPFGGGGQGRLEQDQQYLPPAADPGAAEAPRWFDADGFVAGAKTHFIRLQAAWDKSDFRDIGEYTSPQLFAELKREREALGEAPNYTEVVTLNAELLGVQRDGDQVIASVHFTGLIREAETAPATPLDEIWHVAHDWDSAAGDWLITGIQQPE